MEKEELVKMLQDIIRLVENGLEEIDSEISDAVSTLENIDCSK